MNKRFVLCAGILGGAIFSTSATPARGVVVYTYVTDQPSYTVTPGGTVTAYVYLREALTGTSTSVITQYNGLIGAGFSATQAGSEPSSPTLLTHVAGSVRSNGDNFFGGFFNANPYNTSRNTGGVETISSSASVGPIPDAYDALDGETDLIELGSFTLTGGAATGTTSFVLANYNYPLVAGGIPSPGVYTSTLTVTPSKVGLDANSTSPAYLGTDSNLQTFTVTVTPEPGSLSLLGVAAVGLLARRRRTLPPNPAHTHLRS